MYFNVGDFVFKKGTGDIFRIITIHMKQTGGYKYVMVPVEYQMNDIKEIDGEHITEYEKS